MGSAKCREKVGRQKIDRNNIAWGQSKVLKVRDTFSAFKSNIFQWVYWCQSVNERRHKSCPQELMIVCVSKVSLYGHALYHCYFSREKRVLVSLKTNTLHKYASKYVNFFWYTTVRCFTLHLARWEKFKDCMRESVSSKSKLTTYKLHGAFMSQQYIVS